MQPCGREMQSINSILNQQFDPTHDEFLDQILSSVPSNSWPPDLSSVTGGNNAGTSANKPHQAQAQAQAPPWDNLSQTHLGDASLEDHRSTTNSLASKLRQHQIGSSKALMFQQQLMLSSGLASDSASGNNGLRSPTTENGGFLPMPLHSNGDHDDISPFDSAHSANDASVQALYDQFTGSLGQPSNQLHHFQRARGAVIQAHQNIGATMNIQSAVGSGSTGTGGEGGPALQPKQQRVRARRGQATDPHSIAERLRRERIAERMKALQELVPNANKTDKASMLDEIVDYVKFLQLQVKVLSMSRLGGAATVAPRAAVMSSEVGEAVQGNGRSSNGTAPPTAAASSSNDTMTVTEHQVAKLMEEDMGSAMQYLQGKGLCLMPISLATAISTATCQQPRNSNLIRHHTATTNNHNHHNHNHHVGLGSGGNGVGDGSGGPSSPNISGLTVQSATLGADPSVKDAASVSKP